MRMRAISEPQPHGARLQRSTPSFSASSALSHSEVVEIDTKAIIAAGKLHDAASNPPLSPVSHHTPHIPHI